MTTRFTRTRATTQESRRLKRNATNAERRLWQALRSGQVDGASFRRQHPIRPYIVDFCAPSLKLVIELDGGQHGREPFIAKDAARTEWLTKQGFVILRFWNNDVLGNDEGVVAEIVRVVSERKNDPS